MASTKEPLSIALIVAGPGDLCVHGLSAQEPQGAGI